MDRLCDVRAELDGLHLGGPANPRTYDLMEKGLKTRIGNAAHLFRKLDALQGHQHEINSINFDEAVRYRYAET
jgi:hypothetical protein